MPRVIASAASQPPAAPRRPNRRNPETTSGTVNASFTTEIANTNRFCARARITPSSGSAARGMLLDHDDAERDAERQRVRGLTAQTLARDVQAVLSQHHPPARGCPERGAD